MHTFCAGKVTMRGSPLIPRPLQQNENMWILALSTITKKTLTATPLLSKIADICLIREMFEGADPRLL